MNAKEKQNIIVKNIIKPILKQRGYKNKGNNYRKEEEEFFKVITLQNFTWNNINDVEFCFNFGILVKDIDLSFELPDNFGVQHCHIQVRESCFLTESRNMEKYRSNKQYNINAETDENEFGLLIEEDFKLYFLRDFDNLKTLDDCLIRFGDLPFWGERIRQAISKHQCYMYRTF